MADGSNAPLVPGGQLTGDDVRKKMGAGAASILIVNAYALALKQLQITPPTTPPPDWYATLAGNLDTAKGHAENWLAIAADISSAVPTSIIEFGSEFKGAVQLISDAIDKADGLDPKSQQYKSLVAQVVKYLGQLRTKLAAIDAVIEKVGTQLAQAQADAADDFDALTNGIDSIQGAETQLAGLIAQANADITILRARIDADNKTLTYLYMGLGFGILILVAGIAFSIVTGGTTAGLVVAGGAIIAAGTIGGIGYLVDDIKKSTGKIVQDQADIAADERQIVSLKALDMSIDMLRTNSTRAQEAMENVRGQWKTIDSTLDDLIGNINAVEDPMTKALDKLALLTAAEEWGALVDLVTGFEQQPPKTETRMIYPEAA